MFNLKKGDKKEEDTKSAKKAVVVKGVKKEAKKTESVDIKKERKVIIKVHVTEKATDLKNAENSAYVFRVRVAANKKMIEQEIKEKYGVKPVRVNIINVPSKKRSVRGRKRNKPGFKKAMVFLKKGDKIST